MSVSAPYCYKHRHTYRHLHHLANGLHKAVCESQHHNIAQYYNMHKSLPCFLLDNAQDCATVKFLQHLGCCCVNWRCALTQRLLEMNTFVVFDVPQSKLNFDEAVLFGEPQQIHSLMMSGRATSEFTAYYWTDTVVQTFCAQTLGECIVLHMRHSISLLPDAVMKMIADFLISWENVQDLVRVKKTQKRASACVLQ